MANTLDKFNSSVIGSKGDIYDYEDVITSSGDFKRNSRLYVVMKSWNNILLTQRRSFTYDPDYGSDLYKYVFEPADEITSQTIVEEVEDTLTLYDDRAKITSIDVSFLADKKGFILDIGVEYEGEKGSFTSVINEDLYAKI